MPNSNRLKHGGLLNKLKIVNVTNFLSIGTYRYLVQFLILGNLGTWVQK